MFSLRSIHNYFATAFTFYVGGGIGEAALLGAAIGGGTSVITGQDPLKGALMGGLTGGAFSGIGSALGAGAGAGAGADIATQIPNTMTTELTGAIPESLGGMSNAALTQGAGINSLAQNATQQLATQIPNTMTAELTGAGAGGAGAGATQGGIRGALNLKPESLASKGLDWWDKQDTLTQAGLGGIGLMGANEFMNPYEAPTIEKYKSKLAGYNRESFTPYDQQQPNPYPSAQYAQGGIAALAGPQDSMYPQSQQANTHYATPSQMPTSAEVVNSGYEAQTNPYTGEPVGYAAGGNTGMGGQQSYRGMSGMQNAIGGMGSLGAMINNVISKQSSNAARYDPAAYRQGQSSRQAPQAQSGAHIYKPQYAEGGIAGYSLGGYAAGGNPRLLKGPGDGVSDSIPATIGDKQPARLADGEFVLPARIVSELGNGSTDAGAKALYAMMDRVQNGRKKSIGKNKIATNTNPTKHLPV